MRSSESKANYILENLDPRNALRKNETYGYRFNDQEQTLY